MGYAYISYCIKNQVEADIICNILHENHLKTWIAPENVPMKKEYNSAINQAIQECSCFVVFLSEQAEKSDNVVKELKLAASYHKTIIPIHLDYYDLSKEIRLCIASNKNIYLNSLTNVDAIEEIVVAVSTVLGINVKKFRKKYEKKLAKKRSIIMNKGFYKGKLNKNLTGTGEYFFNNKHYYCGQLKDGIWNGKGKFLYKDGRRYIGHFVAGKFQGKGELFYNHSGRYIGKWRYGERHGKGELLYHNGDRYVGKWKYGDRHGKGTYYYNNGDRYVGQWFNSECHGKGTIYYANGDSYKGHWLKGTLNGKGKYIYKNGEYFVGMFENNNKVKGQLYSPKGKVIEKIIDGERNLL